MHLGIYKFINNIKNCEIIFFPVVYAIHSNLRIILKIINKIYTS